MNRRNQNRSNVVAVIRVVVLIIILFAVGKSDKVGDIVATLPFLTEVTSVFKDVMGITFDFLNSKRLEEYFIWTEIYSDVMKALLSTLISWVFSIPLIQVVFRFVWPTDDSPDSADPHNIWDHDRGMNTEARYFVLGLIATTLSGLVYKFLFEGGRMPGIAVQDAANAAKGIYSLTVVIAAVGYLLIAVALTVGRRLVSGRGAGYYTLFFFGSRSFGRVGFVGFLFASFIRDILGTFVNTMIIMMLYGFISSPSGMEAVGTLLLIGLGIFLTVSRGGT